MGIRTIRVNGVAVWNAESSTVPRYQMRVRFSGATHIPSPSFTSNAR